MRVDNNLHEIFPSARWIGMPEVFRGRSSPLLRREFKVEATVTSATLTICGLGYYEAYLNGCRVGDHVLDPAQTDYDLRCLYVTYDVTSQLQPGYNVLGVMLGDGWFNQDCVWCDGKGLPYGPPRLLAQLTIDQSNGTCLVVSTDENWFCAIGPITRSNVYAGESYDARLEIPGWNIPGFDAVGWKSVEILSPPGGRLEPQLIPPIKVIEEIVPVSITEPCVGCWVVDMGQNFAGWARIRVNAPAGTLIRLRFSETIAPDGMVDMASTGVFAIRVEQTDTYICKGGGLETWEPRFTYHGFRYVEITGWPGRPTHEEITGIVVHTALLPAGSFKCSDERLNQLHQMVLWTHRSNLHGIPEDCPVRERCGWLGDAHLVCEYSIYNFQGQAFWEKYLDDIETTRVRNGGLPFYIAPGKRTCGTASPDWMAALILIPWYLYVYYGNRYVLEQHWEGMRAVLEHFRHKADNWLVEGGLGDWCDPKNSTAPTYTPPILTTTIWFYECARIMSKVANQLGHSDDACRYDEWICHIRQSFIVNLYDSKCCTFGSQTADAMALHFGLVPSGSESGVFRSLVRDVRETHNLHSSVGIMGIRYLFEVLIRFGQGHTALDLMHQNTYPSFGDLISRGATTLWEYWGEPEVDQSNGPRSLNHPMMGGFDNLFYNTLAGIRPDCDHPGFKHFFLEPYPIRGLTWVKAYHDSPHGRIVSEWRQENGYFEWKIEVPTDTTATARMPYGQDIRKLEPGNYLLTNQCDENAQMGRKTQ
ncbi:MAG: family 78 glycoside hydrolase catalytic domain [Phycisphaerae bacterium]